jgi:hypothetical protein
MGGSVHHGILQSALWIQQHYGERIESHCKEFGAKAVYFVGHSLGGSIAAVLLQLFRERLLALMGESLYLKCFNYGTAPCISHNLVKEFNPFVENYINEYDPVPKLSYGSVMDLKGILNHAATVSLEKISRKEKLESLHKYVENQKSLNENPRLFIPGKVYFMYKTTRIDPDQKNNKIKSLSTGNPLIDAPSPHYIVENSSPDHFGDVHIKMDMIFHHFLNKYDNALRNAHDFLVAYQKSSQAEK